MHDFRPEKILQRGKQSGGCLFDDRLAWQGNHPREIGSRAGEARLNDKALGAVGVTNQRPLVGNRDFGGIGNGRDHHAVGQRRQRQEQEKQE